MNNLKHTLFFTAVFVAVIFVFGLMDNIDRPIINFASYFYLAVLVAFPATLFFPSIANVKPYIPMFVWAGIYLVILQVIDRSESTKAIEFAVIVLEFVLLEFGVWLSHRLAAQISQAESFLEALALGAFPSRARSIEQEQPRIKMEFSRSRRYDRPLSLVMIESEAEDPGVTKALLNNIQDDLLHRFKAARVGQIIDEFTRQTDLILKDQKGRFVILCPETDDQTVVGLAQRLAHDVMQRTGLSIQVGVASFPGDALSFDDLLDKARERCTRSMPVSSEQLASVNIR